MGLKSLMLSLGFVLFASTALSQANDAKDGPPLRRRVAEAVKQRLEAAGRNNWFNDSSMIQNWELRSNPMVRYPHIPISCGNSHVGYFDLTMARRAAEEMFALYGCSLQPEIRIVGRGYAFVAEGFDAAKKTGYKIILPVRNSRFFKVTPEPPERHLDDGELAALDDAIARGELRMFVVRADLYPNMDNDHYTPLFYFLASAISYLDAVTKRKESSLPRPLESGPRQRGDHEWFHRPGAPFKGCDFETDEDLEYWKVSGGSLSRSSEWAGCRRSSLQLNLEPGGVAVYTPPREESEYLMKSGEDYMAGRFCSYLKLSRSVDAAVSVTFEFETEEAGRYRVVEIIGRDESRKFIRPNFSAVSGRVRALRISTSATGPIVLHLDYISQF